MESPKNKPLEEPFDSFEFYAIDFVKYVTGIILLDRLEFPIFEDLLKQITNYEII